jgi:hypothetical protein
MYLPAAHENTLITGDRKVHDIQGNLKVTEHGLFSGYLMMLH